MKLDLSAFKKVHEDDAKAVMQHPDGHEIHIKKKSLKPDQVKQMAQMPTQRSNFDDGGVITDPNKSYGDESGTDDAPGQPQHTKAAPKPSPTTTTTWGDRWNQLTQGIGKAHGGMIRNYADGTPDTPVQPVFDDTSGATGSWDAPPPQPAPTPAPATQAAAPQDFYGYGAENAALMGGIAQQKAGIQAEAAAQGQLGQDTAAINTQQGNDTTQLLQDYQTHYNAIDDENKALQHDIVTGQIDPNHFVSSKDTVGRISMGIGLLLGGLGSGNGHGNQALDFLNKQIDRDIAGQEANLGNKKTLLEANMRQYGNLRDATDATRLMMNQTTQSNLAAAAGRSADPMAKARAQQAIGQLQQQAAPLQQQMAMRRAFMGGGAKGLDPAMQIQISPLIPANQKDQAFKDLDTYKKTEATRQQALEAFDHLNGKLLGGVLNPSDREGAIQSVAGQLVKLNGARYNQDNAHGLVNSLMPKGADLPETRMNNRKRLLAEINGNANSSLLDGSGIKAPPSGQYDENGLNRLEQQALQQANANPNDPRSAQVIQILKRKMP